MKITCVRVMLTQEKLRSYDESKCDFSSDNASHSREAENDDDDLASRSNGSTECLTDEEICQEIQDDADASSMSPTLQDAECESWSRPRSRGSITEDDLIASSLTVEPDEDPRCRDMDGESDDGSDLRSRPRSRSVVFEDTAQSDEEDISSMRGRPRSRGSITEEDLDAFTKDSCTGRESGEKTVAFEDDSLVERRCRSQSSMTEAELNPVSNAAGYPVHRKSRTMSDLPTQSECQKTSARSQKSVRFGKRFERQFTSSLHAESDGQDIMELEDQRLMEKTHERQRLREEMRKEYEGYPKV